MLELEYFKKHVAQATEGFLTRTGFPESTFFTLENDPATNRPTSIAQYPMSGAVLGPDGSGHEFMRSIVAEAEVFATCLCQPQWLLSYRLGGKLRTDFATVLYDAHGLLLDRWYQLLQVCDERDLRVQRAFTNCFEYPVAYQSFERRARQVGALQANGYVEPVLGCTQQLFTLRARADGFGGFEVVGTAERGSEYGDVMNLNLLGRRLRPQPYELVEHTSWAGLCHWQHDVRQAESLLVGAAVPLPLADVSRFPPPPLSEPPATNYGNLY